MMAGLPAAIRLVDLETVASTNDEALTLARQGAPAWTVVRARRQTAGRGRHGKAFASPPGNSYTSFVLRPQGAREHLPQIALVAGLAVAETISELAPRLPPALCKWPNDILVAGHKVCGILVEAAGRSARSDPAPDAVPDAVIVGIGVNLVRHPRLPPLRIGDLHALGGPALHRDAWLAALCRHLPGRIATWQQAGFPALRKAWLARAAGLGEQVVLQRGAPLHGRLRGIDGQGALLIDDRRGIAHRCHSGALVLKDAA